MRQDGKIDYVEFSGGNLQEIKRFYGQAFGWNFTDHGPDYMAFEGSGVDCGFAAEEAKAATGPLVVFYAHDLEAMEARARAAGAVITRDIFSFPGGRRFHFRDPAGNEVGVWSAVRTGVADAHRLDRAAAAPYRAMAYNNAWANHRLLTACAALDTADFQAERTGFFPSLAKTLNHILVVDRFYVDALEGGSLGPAAWAEDMPCPTLAALHAEQRAADDRLIAVCDALTADNLADDVQINRGDRVQVERRDRLLLHLFQHQTHHRGQAHAMLSATTVKPPQLDEFFAAGEAPLRAGEFAELSWTEATVWEP